MLVRQLALLCLKFAKKDWNVRNLLSFLGTLPNIPITCERSLNRSCDNKKSYELSPDDQKHQNVNDTRGWFWWCNITITSCIITGYIFFYFFKIIFTFFQFFIFWKKLSVSTACISHLHLANARYAHIRSSCYRHLFWSLIHPSDPGDPSDHMLPPKSGLFQLLLIATPKFRSTFYISCFNRCVRWRVFHPVVCWNRCDHCGTLTLDFQ